MEGEEPGQREAEDQVRAALDMIHGTVLRLLQEGETHPQLAVLSVVMVAAPPSVSAPRRATGEQAKKLRAEVG